jgi:hypothetical protein
MAIVTGLFQRLEILPPESFALCDLGMEPCGSPFVFAALGNVDAGTFSGAMIGVLAPTEASDGDELNHAPFAAVGSFK